MLSHRQVPGFLVEPLVPYTRELAALVARSPSGQAVAYPVVETVQVDGICREVYAPAPGLSDEALCARVYERAFVAHRAAQGGGSGVDVAASAYGGVLAARREAGALALGRSSLPSALHFDVWACSVAASTSAFLARIAELAARDPAVHGARIAAQAGAAEAALAACENGDAPGFVASIGRQVGTLTALGMAAGVNIVTAELAELARLADAEGAAFLPAGAGGGDVAYWVGPSAPPATFAARARELGLSHLPLSLGARGVHAAD